MTDENAGFLPEEQLIRKALQTLLDNLGPVEASRFLSLTRDGRIESVLRHRQWQEKLDRDEFFQEIFSE